MSLDWKAINGTLSAFASSYWSTLLIAGVLGYLGLFTVLRRIVFTSVALAQLAAAGVAAALFLSERQSLPSIARAWLHRAGPTVGSISFCLLGMLGLESRRLRRRFSSDALVGLAYAAASALAILLVWRSAVGLVELQNIIAGDVLLSSDRERISLTVGLVAVALLHVVRREEFLIVSFDPDFARARGYDERRQQFLLLGSLAVGVALSLRAAGLLLVFAVLVLPAMIGLALGRDLRQASLLATASAMLATLIGFVVAISQDWPVAPSISLALLALLGLAVLSSRIAALTAVMKISMYAGSALAIAVGLGTRPPTDRAASPVDFHAGESHAGVSPELETARAVALETLAAAGSDASRIEAAQHLAEFGTDNDLEPLLGAYLDESPPVQAAVLEALRSRAAASASVQGRLHRLAKGQDTSLALRAAAVLRHLGEPLGIRYSIRILARDDLSLLPRADLLEELAAISGDEFDYDPFGDPAANVPAIERWNAWWLEVENRIVFDRQSGWLVP